MMQIKELVFDLLMNICLLSVLAGLLSKVKFIQRLLQQEVRGWKKDLLLSAVFAVMIIVSVHFGITVGEYSISTKVIGAMAAGLLGGPLVGIFSSLLGGAYIYFFSPDMTFALPSAYSVMLIGMLGGGFYPYFQRGKWKYKDLFLLTCFAEVVEIICLLRFTVPVQTAFETVLEISGPMILMNSVGMLIFISGFNTVFIHQESESTKQLQIASVIAKKSLSLLNDGFHNQENLRKMAEIILAETEWLGVMITDESEVLEWRQKDMKFQPKGEIGFPNVAKAAMESGKLEMLTSVPREHPWYEWIGEYSVIAEPFMIKDKAVGCLLIWVKKQFVFHQSDLELLHNFVMIMSSQLAISRLEKQEKMRRQAEFKALQFQVNPHFLFNALNTISSVCRENPGSARELLVTLADYFRYNLGNDDYMVSLEEEMEHVKDYLKIEKARFEDKLIVSYDLEEDMHILIPTLILQPIVENAIRHGRSADGKRIVDICVKEEREGYVVRVSDKGPGFDEDVLRKLEAGEEIGKSIGLSNVHKRLKNIYGEKNGLRIESEPGKGSSVTMYFWKGVNAG